MTGKMLSTLLKVWGMILWCCLSTVLAHGGHLEMRGFGVDQVAEKTYLVGKIEYPSDDGVLILQAVSNDRFSVAFEREHNGKWEHVAVIPIEGDFEFTPNSEYRMVFPKDFHTTDLQTATLPFTFLFENGGLQVVDVRVRSGFLNVSPWFVVLSIAVGMAFRRWRRNRDRPYSIFRS